MHRIQITAEITPDTTDGGFSVYCPEFDVYSQGETIEESIKNIREAVIGYIKVAGLENAIKEHKPPLKETLELIIK